jgi:hypothetical protein
MKFNWLCVQKDALSIIQLVLSTLRLPLYHKTVIFSYFPVLKFQHWDFATLLLHGTGSHVCTSNLRFQCFKINSRWDQDGGTNFLFLKKYLTCQPFTSLTAWPLKMRPICCPETSVKDYHSTLRSIPEDSRSTHSFVSSTGHCNSQMVDVNSVVYFYLNTSFDHGCLKSKWEFSSSIFNFGEEHPEYCCSSI